MSRNKDCCMSVCFVGWWFLYHWKPWASCLLSTALRWRRWSTRQRRKEGRRPREFKHTNFRCFYSQQHGSAIVPNIHGFKGWAKQWEPFIGHPCHLHKPSIIGSIESPQTNRSYNTTLLAFFDDSVQSRYAASQIRMKGDMGHKLLSSRSQGCCWQVGIFVR